MGWIRRSKTSDEQIEAGAAWNRQQKLRKAMQHGYRAHGLGVGHKSLTKCACSRTPKQRRRVPASRPTTKFLKMARRNMLRKEALYAS